MADKKISELDLALLINNDAVFPVSQDNAGEPTTFKVGITQLGTKIAEDMTFSNLQTTSKKLVGAINELLSLGSPIIIGTTAPTSSIGADGNLYVQYTEGTGGADDVVDDIYIKIDGAWCEISTGGGSGTTDYEDLSNKPQVNSVELVGNKSLDDLGIMPASLSKTASGSLVHITDGADNIPVKSLVSEIVAVESGSGEKSPTNPYTISGFDNAVVPVCGVNFFDEVMELGSLNVNTGANNPSNVDIRSKNHIRVKPNTTYFFYATPAVANVSNYGLGFYDINKTYISGGINKAKMPFTTPNNAFFIRFFVPSSWYGGTTYNNDISINYPSTDTQYHAYNGNTYTFAFGQTVYGGYFDNKGNLVVTWAAIDLGSLTWNYDSTYDRFLSNSFNIDGLPATRTMRCLCSCYQTISDGRPLAQVPNNSIYNGGGSKTLIVHDNRFTVGTDLKTALNGQYCTYQLETPITLEITSQDIPTLLGENNIYSNCGDIEVTYYTDNADEIVEVVKANKTWTTLGTLTESGTPLDILDYSELLIYPKINGATYFAPIVIDVPEFNNASTIHFSIYQDNSHSYMGGLDYSDGSISFRRILISGWTSCDCVVKAR